MLISARIILLFLIVVIAITGCATQGLITDKYDNDFYAVPRVLPDTLDASAVNRFIVYGDNRQGYRLNEVFLRKENWQTWKLLLFPFYELYMLGNGIVGGINNLRRVPDYGAETRKMVRNAIYAAAEKQPVDFIFHSGDFVADGRIPRNWAGFIRENKIEKPLMTDFPYVTMLGNHEFGNDSTYGLPNYQAVFPYPSFYTIEMEFATLIVLDSDLIVDQYEFIDDDYQDILFQKWFVADSNSERKSWLEEKLSQSTKPFKIVFMHHPPVSFGVHHTDWKNENFGFDLKKKRKALLELLAKYDVQLVVSGHEHYYEHNVVHIPKHSGDMHSMQILVSGGGGVTLRSLTGSKSLANYLENYEVEKLNVEMILQKQIYHYCLFNISRKEISIQVIEVVKNNGIQTNIADELKIRL